MLALEKLLPGLAALALAAVPFAPPAPAALLSGAPAQDEGEGDEDEEEAEDESGKVFAVVNAEIHTGTGAVLRDASLMAREGKIVAIGYELDLPDDAEVLDAQGMRVYPGLIAVDSANLLGTSRDFADSVDPFSQTMVLALASGITSCGQSRTALKLKRGKIEGVVLREDYLNSQTWSDRNPATKRSLREKLAKADAYLRKYRVWEEQVKEDKELKEPSKRGVDTTALKILRGEVLAQFSADGRNELLGIARLAQEYGFRPVIEGCLEGWTVADELGRAGAYAIVTPRTRRDKSERETRPGGSTIENAALLHAAGVQVAVVPGAKGITTLGGIAGRDIIHLPIEVGFAIRGGLPEDAGLRSMTQIPARILGVSHRVGTLEVGKDCDLIVTDGDVLHYQTFVQYTVVEGEVVYDKQDELLYAHIRPRPEPELAPSERTDAGEEAEPDEDADADDEDGDEDEDEDEEATEEPDEDEDD